MTTKRRHSCNIDRTDEEQQHLKLVEELDLLTLSDSCCEICHCDCYNSHRPLDEKIFKRNFPKQESNKSCIRSEAHSNKVHKDRNNNHKSGYKRKSNGSTDITNTNTKVKVKKKRNSLISQERRARSKSPLSESKRSKRTLKSTLKRSKSAGSLHTLNQYSTTSKSHFTRDCELLQDLLTTLHTPRIEITGHMRPPTQIYSKSTLELPTSSKAAKIDATWTSPKICESLANLCLAPEIREAYQQVPTHDKKILNRMASKRSEKVIAKENAWLARKFWENERYERELFKCEQMEEYKRAVRDKQFQDYLLTKERLNELAQRDYQELQRLRQSLAYKDALTKQRLEALRVERDLTLCQRRCEELKKSEAVNIHQEEQNLCDILRKQEICNRLTFRLRRANEIRNQMLNGYLKRLKYDNYVEQIMHDQHWRETQEQEVLKREQLKEHINAKSKGTQRFIDQRQRRMENVAKTAKISASLRELVKSSVSPEGTLTVANYATNTANLGKLLYDKPFPKNSTNF